MSEEEYDEDIIIGPTNWLFEDWFAAGEAYAAKNFPDWHPEMVKEFGSDLAWQMEGAVLTPSKMEKASEDWFSGANPYSPHTVPNDGFDYEQWGKRERRDSRVAVEAYGLAQGMDQKTAKRFADDVMKEYSTIYDTSFESAFSEWFAGKNKFSPHYVAFDDENVKLRNERRNALRAKYAHVSDFSFRIFFNNRLTDSAIIENHLMSKKQ